MACSSSYPGRFHNSSDRNHLAWALFPRARLYNPRPSAAVPLRASPRELSCLVETIVLYRALDLPSSAFSSLMLVPGTHM